MKILFANLNPFLPQLVGGVETSTLELCQALNDTGHETSLVCPILPKGWTWKLNMLRRVLLRKPFPKEQYKGINVYRGYNIHVGILEVASAFKPDAVVVQGSKIEAIMLARFCHEQGLPTYFYVHDLGAFEDFPASIEASRIRWIANSGFTSRFLQKKLGVASPVVPPYFKVSRYKTRPGNAVTMINPRSHKGGALALDAAEICSEIPFLFVEGWDPSDPRVRSLRDRAAGLNNVEWLGTTTDMKSVYRRTKLLIVPSQCEETWGRVVTEAQFCAIPSIVADIGALPETIGPGGLIMPAKATAQDWATAIRSLMNSPEDYQIAAKSAHEFSFRPEIGEDRLATNFINALLHSQASPINT